MTHAVYTQLKPSLSVRTRALTNKYHTKRFNRHALLLHSLNSRLRHRIGNATLNSDSSGGDKQPEHSQVLGQCTANDNNSSSALTHTNSSVSSTAYISDAYASSSASSVSSSSNNKLSTCKWQGCEAVEVKQSQLVNHIQEVHVLPQLLSTRRKCFSCLWHDCRVFGRPSVSFAWLEHHVLHHTDAKGKPFRCIFDSCNMRFSTSTLLERHVRRVHMFTNRSNQSSQPPLPIALPHLTDSQTTAQSPTKQSDTATPTKKYRRKKKTKPYRVRRIDFYDTRSQAVIHNRLKISRILSTNFQQLLSEANQTAPTECGLLYRLPSSRICDQLSMKTRLRSCLNEKSLHPSKLSSSNDFNFKDLTRIHRNILLLLTTPHVFIGQRSSEHNRCEFLVRWVGELDRSEMPPSWIFEDELRIAARLEKYF